MHVALHSVPRIPKQYSHSVQKVSRLVIQDVHKVCPSSSSIGMSKQQLQCTRCAQACTHAVHKLGTGLGTCVATFPSSFQVCMGTLSVTASTQLVHFCEQVSFQVGHSKLLQTWGCAILSGQALTQAYTSSFLVFLHQQVSGSVSQFHGSAPSREHCVLYELLCALPVSQVKLHL